MAAIRESLPLPPVPVVKPKLEHLAENRDDYDTLFIGSSLVYFHIAPAIFDSVAAQHGIATRSFNLGVAAMKVPENAFLWDAVAELRLQGLRRVFIEVTGFDDRIESERLNWRDRYWHDWERTSLVIGELLRRTEAELEASHWEETIGIWLDVAEHLTLFLAETSNVGRGSELLERLDGIEPKRVRHRSLGPGGDGFLPKHAQLPPGIRAEFDRDLEQRRTIDLRERKMAKAGVAALREMIEQIRASGAQPYLFLAPVMDSKKFDVAELFPDVPVFDFHDVEEYPELFRPEERYDADHFNVRGAETFTRLLAEEFVERLGQVESAGAGAAPRLSSRAEQTR